MRSHLTHVSSLHLAAESSPQFMGSSFDDRVVRDADNRTICAIQGHRDPGSLSKQVLQLFLKRRRRFIHESASTWGMTGDLDRQVAALYHRIDRFSY
jgi:hypothetical protein